MTLEVSSEVMEVLLRQAGAAHPRECCGILLGEGNRIATAIPAANVHPTPESHFEVDPQALVDAHRHARSGGPQVVGYYHSHPDGRAEPSATDRVMAANDGSVWAIVGGAEVGFWRLGEDGFVPLPYRLLGG